MGKGGKKGRERALGTFPDLWSQHLSIKSKIQSLFATKKEWANASGVEIMEYMFNTPSFFADPAHPVKFWLHLFNHCILKTRCEAVVEGMGCVLDNHADPIRHLSMDKFTKEAMIHWNGPSTRECEDFLEAALNEHFGDRPWNFHRTGQDPSVYPNGPKLHDYLQSPKYRSKFPWWTAKHTMA